MKKLVVASLILVFLLVGCGDNPVYRVHFVNGDVIEVECFMSQQYTANGHPVFTCDGTAFGNITYVERIEE